MKVTGFSKIKILKLKKRLNSPNQYKCHAFLFIIGFECGISFQANIGI